MANKTLTHEYTPRGAALALMTDKSPEVVCAGPAGTGKSHAGLMKLHLCLMAKPGAQALLVRKTAVSLTSTSLVTWRKTVAVEAIRAGICKWYGGSSEEAAGYRYSNGSKLLVGGMDKPEKIMSSEYDLIAADEGTELTLDDWEMMGTRARNGVLSYQQLLLLCNPNRPTHWVKQRCDTGTARMLVSRHEDNPRYYTQDGNLTDEGVSYMARLDALSGVRYLRLRKGIWAAAEGLVYDEFDENVHLIDSFPIPHDWPRLWSVDFGYTHPMVIQCWARDPDGRMILYREFVRTQTLVEDFARWVLKTVTKASGDWIEPRPQRIICDHDAEGRAVLEKYLALPTSAAHKAVTEGIQAVQGRLKPAGDGKPRLLIMRGALVKRDQAMDDAKRPQGFAEEVTGYVWAQDTKGLKEVPVKDMDDSADCARYAIADQDLGLKPRVRWI